MRKIEQLNVSYVGYANPNTEEEISIEILGLKTAIETARLRISVLEQSKEICDSINKEKTKE